MYVLCLIFPRKLNLLAIYLLQFMCIVACPDLRCPMGNVIGLILGGFGNPVAGVAVSAGKLPRNLV